MGGPTDDGQEGRTGTRSRQNAAHAVVRRVASCCNQNMHDARQHQAETREERRGNPGLWSLRNLGALEAGPFCIAPRRVCGLGSRRSLEGSSKVNSALEAGRLAGGGVSPPSAQAYAIPSYISGGATAGAPLAGLTCWWDGVVPPGWGRCPGNQLGGALQQHGSTAGQRMGERERPSAKTQQPPSQGKTCLHAGSSPQKRSPELRRLNFLPQPSLTHSAHLLSASSQQQSAAQLSSAQPSPTQLGLTRA